MLSIALLSLFLASVGGTTCSDSTNADTNSQEECKYLSPCTIENGKFPLSAPEGYTIECETMPCPADQDIMFDKDGGTDIGELLPASCDNTVAMCMSACEATAGCCGFNFVWNPGQYSSTSMGRCVAKGCDGSIVTSRFGMVYFGRDGGAVPSADEADHADDHADHGIEDPTVVVMQFSIAGNLDDLTSAQEQSIRSGIASVANVDPVYVTVAYSQGSVVATAIITVPSGDSAADIESDLQANLGSPTAASSALGVNVESTPTVEVTTQSDANSGIFNNIINAVDGAIKKAVALGTGVLIAIIVAPTVVVLLIIFLIVYCCCCKKKQKTAAVGGAPQSGVEITA